MQVYKWNLCAISSLRPRHASDAEYLTTQGTRAVKSYGFGDSEIILLDLFCCGNSYRRGLDSFRGHRAGSFGRFRRMWYHLRNWKCLFLIVLSGAPWHTRCHTFSVQRCRGDSDFSTRCSDSALKTLITHSVERCFVGVISSMCIAIWGGQGHLLIKRSLRAGDDGLRHRGGAVATEVHLVKRCVGRVAGLGGVWLLVHPPCQQVWVETRAVVLNTTAS